MAKAKAKAKAKEAEVVEEEDEDEGEEGEGDDEENQFLMEDDDGSLTVDLSDVEADAGFEVIPRGWYTAISGDSDYTESENSGKPMFTVDWKITDGEYEGRTFRQFLSFSPKALSRTKAMLGKLAPQLLEGPFKPEEVVDEGILDDLEGEIRLGINKYEGERRNNVRDVRLSEGGFLDS